MFHIGCHMKFCFAFDELRVRINISDSFCLMLTSYSKLGIIFIPDEQVALYLHNHHNQDQCQMKQTCFQYQTLSIDKGKVSLIRADMDELNLDFLILNW